MLDNRGETYSQVSTVFDLIRYDSFNPAYTQFIIVIRMHICETLYKDSSDLLLCVYYSYSISICQYTYSDIYPQYPSNGLNTIFPIGGVIWCNIIFINSIQIGCGPIQLWQFLLELLLDSKCQSFIHWTDSLG